MIKRIVKLTFQQGKVSEFLTIFHARKKRIRSSDGCLYLELLREHPDGNVLFTVSHWRDQAALDQYRNSDFFKATWPKAKSLFAEKPEAWSLDSVEVLSDTNEE